MKRIKIGFTGTQKGMTNQQKKMVTLFFDNLLKKYEVISAHHGDCIGADKQFHSFAKYYKIKTVTHPPLNSSKRAFCDADQEMPKDDYLVRNRNIVDSVDIMLATPKENDEVLRSGTWATIRYSRKKRKQLAIIFPNGKVKINE